MATSHSPTPSLRVLASGSGGNCSVLRTAGTTLLIDAGLSPRKTRKHLADEGIDLDQIDGILLTHLDTDHFHAGWIKGRPERVPVYLHERHAREAVRKGLTWNACRRFEQTLAPSADCCAFALLCAHDDTGTVSFRFEFLCGSSLGFATDIGRTTDALADHLDSVDVLAIESNYCPDLQANSDRPDFLKRRVTGGAGHLANHEAASFVTDVSPRRHVVLLHLSRECNTPERAAQAHADAPYGLTIAHQQTPTPWIEIGPGEEPTVVVTPGADLGLRVG